MHAHAHRRKPVTQPCHRFAAERAFEFAEPQKCCLEATSGDPQSTLPLQVGLGELSRGKPVLKVEVLGFQSFRRPLDRGRSLNGFKLKI